MAAKPSGPLVGVRVLEMANIGPCPHAAMLLSDMGADVVRIDRPDTAPLLEVDVTSRWRGSIVLDLKSRAGRAVAMEAVERADILIEGYRPGVMERLDMGPDVLCALNPRLIYGRMTGWGQSGPLSSIAGHDINYIALTGALAAIGDPDRPPVPPLNLVGDFGGGSLFLVFGLLAALYEREKSGKGQIVDTAMLDGVAALMAVVNGLSHSPAHSVARGQLGLSGVAPNYRCYRCKDGRFVAVGALEPHFHEILLETLGWPYRLSDINPDRSNMAELADKLAAIFATRSRDEWAIIFAGLDACVSPVLELHEAPDHPQAIARGVYCDINGIVQPGPAPRLSRTPGAIQGHAPAMGEGGQARLRQWGVTAVAGNPS